MTTKMPKKPMPPSNPTITTLTDLTDALLTIGYCPGKPPHVRADCEAIDREVAAQSECDNCGRVGLGYHAFHRGRSYVAVATCFGCGHSVDF